MSFNFGTPPSTQAPTSTTGFSFGAPKTAASSTAAPAFGAAAPTFGAVATAAPSFGATAAPSFGGTATPSFGAPTAQPAPNFGAPAQQTPAFNFGGPTAASSAASAAVAPTLSFGAPGATTTNSSIPTLGLGGGSFNFGKPSTTGTSTGASLNFGTTTTSIGGGGFGKPAATLTAPATSAPTAFVGLGGIDVSTTQPRPGDSKQDNIKVKETQLPEEIAKTVEDFKTYNKTQKTHSSEIGRTSTSKLTNVSSEIMNQQWALQEITNAVESYYNEIKILRKETSKALQSVEMAQRTQDTPAGLQFENNAPFQFIQHLVVKYEHDLINIRQQIASTESHMHSLTNPQTVAPEDLKRCLKQINESYIALAGRLHEIHQEVESQKEQFLSLRKYRLRDSTNVFAELDNPQTKVNTTGISAGPTPFSSISAMGNFNKSFANATASGNASGQNAK